MLSVASPLEASELASLARLLVAYHAERPLLLPDIVDFDGKVRECRKPVWVERIELY